MLLLRGAAVTGWGGGGHAGVLLPRPRVCVGSGHGGRERRDAELHLLQERRFRRAGGGGGEGGDGGGEGARDRDGPAGNQGPRRAGVEYRSLHS